PSGLFFARIRHHKLPIPDTIPVILPCPGANSRKPTVAPLQITQQSIGFCNSFYIWFIFNPNKLKIM
ncbi:MAG: hypothetical protein WBH03_06495, partial [Cyclobacteriaceae bacterium]